MQDRTFLVLGASFMAAAVALGAFGAHGLQNMVTAERLLVWQKASFYHFVHALGLILVGILQQQGFTTRGVSTSGWLMLAGILIFSGSLYLLTLSGITWLGAVTPIGGLAFIGAWVMLALSLKR